MVVHVPTLLVGYFLGIVSVVIGFFLGRIPRRNVSLKEPLEEIRVYRERRSGVRKPVSGAVHVEPGGEHDFIENNR